MNQISRIKRIGVLLALCVLWTGCGMLSVQATETDTLQWIHEGDRLDNAYDLHQVEVWEVEDYELDTMYQDAWVLRRSSNATEAYVTFSVPYIEEVEVLSYSWPRHLSPFSLYVSKDGKTWQEAAVTTTEQADAEEGGRWTKILHQAKDLRGMSYIKIVWQENLTDNDWWNPYLGRIEAKLGAPQMEKVVATVPSQLVIPRFDDADYTLSAEAVDQIGQPMEAKLIWSAAEALPQGVRLTPEGVLTVSSDCEEGALVLCASVDTEDVESEVGVESETENEAEESGMRTTVTVQLKKAKIGDTDYDNIIDEKDLDFARRHYGKTASDEEWETLRLADVDGNQKIDIADLAYLAYVAEAEPVSEDTEEHAL